MLSHSPKTLKHCPGKDLSKRWSSGVSCHKFCEYNDYIGYRMGIALTENMCGIRLLLMLSA